MTPMSLSIATVSATQQLAWAAIVVSKLRGLLASFAVQGMTDVYGSNI